MPASGFSEEDLWELAGALQPDPESLAERGIEVGQGDDAAVLSSDFQGGRYLVLSTDPMTEGTHFELATGMTGPADVAWKVVARNLSDLAATGAEPHSVLVTLGVPEDAGRTRVEQFFHGLKEVTGKYGAALIGGDAHRSEIWQTTCTALGLAETPWLRSDLQPGDHLYLTGELGPARLGLALILGELPVGTELDPELRRTALDAINRPTPRTDVVSHLAELGRVGCIDLSDSLSRSLLLLARASKVDLEVEAERLPVADAVGEHLMQLAGTGETAVDTGSAPRELVLARLLLACAGDYQLLFGAAPDALNDVSDWPAGGPHRIGRVTQGAGEVTLRSGDNHEQVESTGYEQF